MLYLSCLKNISFLSPSSSLWNFKGYPCTTFISSFTLLFPFIACPQITLGTLVLQALAEEDSCLQHTLISPPFCPSLGLQPLPDPISLLTASQGFEWLIPDFRPKYTRDTMKGAAFCLFSVPPINRKLYNIVLKHRHLVCKLLPHVHRVFAKQEVQPIIITIPKPVWTFKMYLHAEWEHWTCRKCYIASKDELGSLLGSLCDEQSEVPVQMSVGPGWSLSSARS